MNNFPYIITISSEKGGVGKTTLAVNLAIYLKALQEDLPVTVLSLDNHFTVDRMFEIKGQRQRGTIAEVLDGQPAKELLHTGQYGVNYIPSSATLSGMRTALKGPMAFAQLFASCDIPGIIIIDTRPDLDVMTENALYAADRVIIPVKDMPSLENCRNIFALFDKRGLDKKSLSLIPCLIDSRIKFDGPFGDQKTLLKAYAINRGYRCLDTYISKSPKVESLNTNPDGRIYPILTHARGTEVYNQFTQLSRLLHAEYEQTVETRAALYHQWMTAEEGRRKESFFARLSGVKKECPFCGKQVLNEEAGIPSFYFETSDGRSSGFLDEDCFHRFLMKSVYNLKEDLPLDDPTRLIIQDSARESAFAFKTGQNGSGPVVEFQRYGLDGVQLGSKNYPLKEFEGGLLSRERSQLYSLVSQTLMEEGGSCYDAFLFVHPVHGNDPQAILKDESYRRFARLMQNVAGQV